jgi:hypothetical protein
MAATRPKRGIGAVFDMKDPEAIIRDANKAKRARLEQQSDNVADSNVQQSSSQQQPLRTIPLAVPESNNDGALSDEATSSDQIPDNNTATAARQSVHTSTNVDQNEQTFEDETARLRPVGGPGSGRTDNTRPKINTRAPFMEDSDSSESGQSDEVGNEETDKTNTERERQSKRSGTDRHDGPPGENTAVGGGKEPVEGAEGEDERSTKGDDDGKETETEEEEDQNSDRKMENANFANLYSRYFKRKQAHRHVKNYLGSLPIDESLDAAVELMKKMIENRGIGANWEYTLPIECYLHDGDPDFDIPWVMEDQTELNTKDRERAGWLATAQDLYASAANQSSGITIDQAHEFVSIYSEARRLSRHCDIQPCRTGTLRSGAAVDQALEGLRASLEAFVKSAWQDAFVTARRELGAAGEMGLQVAYRDMIVRRAAMTNPQWELPEHCLWERRWKNFRTMFEARGPDDRLRSEFDDLMRRMWNDAQSSGRYPVPPVMLPGMSCSDYCQAMTAQRDDSQEACSRIWQDEVTAANARSTEDAQIRGENARLPKAETLVVEPHNGPPFETTRDRLEQGQQKFNVHIAGGGWGYQPDDQRLFVTILRERWVQQTSLLGMQDAAIVIDDELLETFLRFENPVAPPEWRNGVSAHQYVTSIQARTLHDAHLRQVSLSWNLEIQALRSGLSPDEEKAHAQEIARDEMLQTCQAGEMEPYGPDQAEFFKIWRPVLNRLRSPSLAPSMKPRLQDIFDKARDVSIAHDITVTPIEAEHGQADSEYIPVLYAAIDHQIDSFCKKAWQLAANKASLDEKKKKKSEFVDMRANAKEYGRYYWPDEWPLQDSEEQRPSAQQLGFEGVRAGQTGTWHFLGTAGEGNFGHAGIWGKMNEFGSVLDKIVVKETYCKDMWDESWLWTGQPGSEPLEYSIVNKIGRLQESYNIVRYRGYAVYDCLRTYRLYMEYCPHGDLNDLIMRHRAIGTRNAEDFAGQPLQR